MGIFKLAFYIILYFLIRLGEWVSSVVNTPLRITRKTISKLRNISFHHTPLFYKRKTVKRGRPRQIERIVIKTSVFYKAKYIIIGGIVCFVLFFIPATLFIFISDLPKIEDLSVNSIAKSTKIFDRNGTLLFEIYANQNRSLIKLNDVPHELREATIAIEDKDFYNHAAIDIRGIARAVVVNVSSGQLQGGSTITQQLVKSALLTPEPTIIRKTKEIVLAFWAEKKYSKNQILELYFNFVPYGGTAWGIQAASEVYFGKDVSQLSLAESSYLAGLPRAPSAYSPFLTDGSKGKNRQKEVLQAMVREKYITQKEADNAFSQKLNFLPPKTPIKAPHFVMYVKELLVSKYGLFTVERGGLQVTTSLDLKKQKLAEEVVLDEVEKNKELGIGNGAALVTDPKNGDILAMVGSKNYFDLAEDGNVNLTTSLRQPGSTIKLVTYALALSSGYTEASILDDTPLTIRPEGGEAYTPVNYDGKFHGKVPLRMAFANSFNIPAVRLAQKLGVDEIVKMGQEMGISSWSTHNDYGVSITLGGAEVTMSDLTSAYGTVANGGKRVALDPLLEIRDFQGITIERKMPEEKQVIGEGVAFIISDILADNRARSIAFGSNSTLSIPNKRVSVKTGTTDNKRDNWTIGFTPDLVVATWVGNNDNTPLSQSLASGVTGAAPMWNRIMNTLVAEHENKEAFVIPSSVVKKQCFGYDAYFLQGTDLSTACRKIFPTPTFQEQ